MIAELTANPIGEVTEPTGLDASVQSDFQILIPNMFKVLKIGRNGTPRDITIALSDDLTELKWKSRLFGSKLGRENSVRVSTIVRLEFGQSTRGFFLSCGTSQFFNQSFSIFYQSSNCVRSLDLIVYDVADFTNLVNLLKKLLIKANPSSRDIGLLEEIDSPNGMHFQNQLANLRYSIDVFHDAENCAIRSKTNGSRLYDVVLKRVLWVLGHEPTEIDIDAMCDVHWRYVLPIRGSLRGPEKSTRTLRELLTRGVLHINPGEKKGAVDLVIKEAMDRLCNEHKEDSFDKKQKRIVVLISGDCDFAGQIRRLRHSGLQTFLVYNPRITAPSFLHLVRTENRLGVWDELVEESAVDTHDTEGQYIEPQLPVSAGTVIESDGVFEVANSKRSEVNTAPKKKKKQKSRIDAEKGLRNPEERNSSKRKPCKQSRSPDLAEQHVTSRISVPSNVDESDRLPTTSSLTEMIREVESNCVPRSITESSGANIERSEGASLDDCNRDNIKSRKASVSRQMQIDTNDMGEDPLAKSTQNISHETSIRTVSVHSQKDQHLGNGIKSEDENNNAIMRVNSRQLMHLPIKKEPIFVATKDYSSIATSLTLDAHDTKGQHIAPQLSVSAGTVIESDGVFEVANSKRSEVNTAPKEKKKQKSRIDAEKGLRNPEEQNSSKRKPCKQSRSPDLAEQHVTSRISVPSNVGESDRLPTTSSLTEMIREVESNCVPRSITESSGANIERSEGASLDDCNRDNIKSRKASVSRQMQIDTNDMGEDPLAKSTQNISHETLIRTVSVHSQKDQHLGNGIKSEDENNNAIMRVNSRQLMHLPIKKEPIFVATKDYLTILISICKVKSIHRPKCFVLHDPNRKYEFKCSLRCHDKVFEGPTVVGGRAKAKNAVSFIALCNLFPNWDSTSQGIAQSIPNLYISDLNPSRRRRNNTVRDLESVYSGSNESSSNSKLRISASITGKSLTVSIIEMMASTLVPVLLIAAVLLSSSLWLVKPSVKTQTKIRYSYSYSVPISTTLWNNTARVGTIHEATTSLSSMSQMIVSSRFPVSYRANGPQKQLEQLHIHRSNTIFAIMTLFKSIAKLAASVMSMPQKVLDCLASTVARFSSHIRFKFDWSS